MPTLLNPFIFANGVTELARDTTLYKDATNLTTYTSDARAIGTASATRRVYAFIMGWAGASRTLNSATIGGVAATIELQINNTNAGNSLIAAIVSATVPTGTTAVVVATFDAGMGSAAIAVISLDNLLSTTPYDSVSATSLTAAVNTGAVFDQPTAGYCMALAIAAANGTPTCVWTNLTETVDDFVDDGTNDVGVSVAFFDVKSSWAYNTDVTATFTGAGTPKSLVAISVR